MAELATIALNDATPTSQDFNPSMKDGLLAVLREDSGSDPALYPSISLGMRAPKAGVNRKVTGRILVPYETTTNDITTVEQVSLFIDCVVPETASTGTVADAMAFGSDLLTNAIVEDAMQNGNFPY
jgi:hypothetical protein